MKKYTLGSLFSGIGGLEMGLEMTGRFETVWQSETDEHCRGVLRKHWPDAELFGDVREFGVNHEIKAVDVVCGGFPCQDLSSAREGSGRGRGDGLAGKKSGLYREFMRILGQVKPRGFIIENVPNLVNRGLEIILGEVAELGYDAEWHIVSAASVGGPHLRKRVFVMGYANGTHPQGRGLPSGVHEKHEDANGTGCRRPDKTWPTEPDVPRVADGVPDWSHRVKALGNAVVPKVASVVGMRMVELLESDKTKETTQ